MASNVSPQLGERAGHLDAGRAAADDDERQEALSVRLALRALGRLEREEDALTDLERVVERLEPGREPLPFVVPEVRRLRPRRDDDVVVRDLTALQDDDAPLEVDPRRCSEEHRRVLLFREDRANRLGDLRRGEPGRCHLIEERLEEVMVRAVDHGDCHRRARERLRRGEPPEAPADDDDMRLRRARPRKSLCVLHEPFALAARRASSSFTFSTSVSGRHGFARNSSQPASFAPAECPASACPVSAMTAT